MRAGMAAWMLYSLFVGAAVYVAALAAADAQHSARRPVRWIWLGAIFSTLVLSAVAPLRHPNVAGPILRMDNAASGPQAGRITAAPHGLADWLAVAARQAELPFSAALRVAERTVRKLPARAAGALAAAWLLASIGGLALLIASYTRVRRRVRLWPARLVANVPVRVAPFSGPAVVGLARPEIVVPAWLLSRPADEQRLVVAHEDEHIRAGDPWTLIAACVALVCMPWHPALWFAFSRLRLAVELDCDRRMLTRGVAASAYGSLLIDLSAVRRTLPSAMPAFAFNGSFLERRLVAMSSRTSSFAAPRRLAGALLAAAAFVTACESKLPTSAEIEKMDGAAATTQAWRASLLDTTNVRYLVDGAVVTADSANAIGASKIASVEVVRATGGASGEIRITSDSAATAARMLASKGVTSASSGTATGTRSFITVTDSASAPNSTLRVRQSHKAKFDGLLVVDGKVADAAQLETISPDRIASVEVLKGAAAQSAYSDPRAVHGVILVTTKPTP